MARYTLVMKHIDDEYDENCTEDTIITANSKDDVIMELLWMMNRAGYYSDALDPRMKGGYY